MHHSFYAVSFFVDIEKGRVLRSLTFLSISHCMICCQRENCVESNNIYNTRYSALSKQQVLRELICYKTPTSSATSGYLYVKL